MTFLTIPDYNGQDLQIEIFPQLPDQKRSFAPMTLQDGSVVYLRLFEFSKKSGIHLSVVDKCLHAEKELSPLLERHISLVAIIKEIVTEKFFTGLLKFSGEQLRGWIDLDNAVGQIKAASPHELLAMAEAGEQGFYYLGKDRSKGRPCVLAHNGTAYFGSGIIVRGTFTKVTGMGPDKVKASAKGIIAVRKLKKHCEMLRKFNTKKIRNIPRNPDFYFDTISKKNLTQKFVALMDRMDGDGDYLYERDEKGGFLRFRWEISAFHAANIIKQAAEALTGMEDAGCISTDIKKENLLILGDVEKSPFIEGTFIRNNLARGFLTDFDMCVEKNKTIEGGTFETIPPEALTVDSLGTRFIKGIAAEPSFHSFSLGATLLSMISFYPKDTPVFCYIKDDKKMREVIINYGLCIWESGITNIEKLLRLRLIKIADALMRIDPDQRLSCHEASCSLEKAMNDTAVDLKERRVEEVLIKIFPQNERDIEGIRKRFGEFLDSTADCGLGTQNS